MNRKNFLFKRALPTWLLLSGAFSLMAFQFVPTAFYFIKIFSILSLLLLIGQYFASTGKMATSPKSLGFSLLIIGLKLFVGIVVFLYYFIKLAPITEGNSTQAILAGFGIYISYTILLVWFAVKAGEEKSKI